MTESAHGQQVGMGVNDSGQEQKWAWAHTKAHPNECTWPMDWTTKSACGQQVGMGANDEQTQTVNLSKNENSCDRMATVK